MKARVIALTAVIAVALIVVPGNTVHALEIAHFAVADFGYDQGWRDEAFDARHPRTVADVTGDGLADIVGFGNAGVFTSVAQGDGNFGEATFVLANFGYDQGWRLDPNLDDQSFGYLRNGQHPRFVVDVTGDGRADIVGFGDAGVYVSVATGDGGFTWPRFVLADFGPHSPAGRGDWWDEHPRFVTEVTGDQWPDIIGIRDSTVWVAAGLGGGNFANKRAALTNSDFGGEDWTLHQDFDQFLADVNADDRSDLVMVGESQTFLALSSPSQSTPFESPYVAAEFGSETMKHIRVVDVTGDKRAEILGAFGKLGSGGLYLSKGLHVSSISTGANGHYGTPRHAGADFFFPEVGYGSVDDYMWAVGDVSGDGFADVIGSPSCDYSPAGCPSTYVAYSRGDGTFTDPVAVLDDFGPGAGWIAGRHLRLTATITRDGHADIVGFGNAGVYVTMTAVSRAVPDVRGTRLPQAADSLRTAGDFVVGQVSYIVDPTCNNIGEVISQSPVAGALAAVGSSVRLSIGKAPSFPHQCN